MRHVDYNRTWYHGSPVRLETVRKGSAVSRHKRVAMAFSHKPSIVSMSEHGNVKHNGRTPGFLYRVEETVGPDDVCPYPGSSEHEAWEWLTKRDLEVSLIGRTTARRDELLSRWQVVGLKTRAAVRRAWRGMRTSRVGRTRGHAA
jgi:hypothetical protein